MPELPEVETVVRSLAPQVTGRRILNAEFSQKRVLRGDAGDAARMLGGRIIQSVGRHGKFIVFTLRPKGFLIVHLGMTGKLLWNGEPAKHTHAIFTLNGGTLLYNDARQFGRIEWAEEMPERVRKLGPDALSVAFEDFADLLKKRKSRIKSVLLNQTFVRGLGNIYADEALFRAGIHPLAIGSKLSKERVRKLYHAIREVLNEAIDRRGSSISDYVDSDGNRGSFQALHRVYRRTGEQCGVCGTAIRRTLVAQRGTHFCPKCQKR
ncbi:MAG: DNA-(apurinic or apyrimidinic site) lyase / Formamidopyrimidine-DNA glycosylase [Bryobacterales bacterium]|nr:DNA-(apurinic or apyrimidinic site) lyase / Formamidopyrimidine-DNA glycosylase [Bryobacterales bacterium]